MSAACVYGPCKTLVTTVPKMWKLSSSCNMCAFGILIKSRLYNSMSACSIFVKKVKQYDRPLVLCSLSRFLRERTTGCPSICRTFTSSNAVCERHNICDKKTLLESKSNKLQGVLKERKDRIKVSGQILLNDIRETKNKMKEKMEEVIERENVFTIPNFLCVSRIIISPYLGYVIIQSNFQLAFGLFVFAGVTDLIDGWVARTYPSQATKIGSFLDPMADKILVAILFVTLTYIELIPIPLTIMIIARDLLLVIAGFYIRYQSLPPPKTLPRYFDVTHATAQLAPTFVSKVNTVVQLSLVATTLASPVFGGVNPEVIHGLWYLTAATTVASACSYIFSRNTYKYLKPKKQDK
ncbi:Probable cardiolipin synthase (CMP-forming) [Gryllus bimaculatus]|nr:Probable cardiolipin synthase (CMP-forming) [Gryllus bimaculatus]